MQVDDDSTTDSVNLNSDNVIVKIMKFQVLIQCQIDALKKSFDFITSKFDSFMEELAKTKEEAAQLETDYQNFEEGEI